MPLFASKKQEKKQTTFSPAQEEMTTQNKTYYSETNYEQNKTKADVMAQFKNTDDLLGYFFHKLNDTIKQLNALHKSFEHIDKSIADDRETLNDPNMSDEVKMVIRENWDLMLEVRQNHLKAINVMAKEIIREEYAFNNRRLQLEKSLFYTKDNNTDNDWKAYSQQITLESKMIVINALKNSACKDLISIPEELNLEVLEAKKERLTEEESAEKAKAQTIVQFENRYKQVDNEIRSQNAADFIRMETTAKPDEILGNCLIYKERYWDRNREAFLDPSNLNANLKDYLFIIEAVDRLSATFNKNHVLFKKYKADIIYKEKIEKAGLTKLSERFFNKKTRATVTKEEKATLEGIWISAENEADIFFKNLLDVMKYMRLHIKNMMADLGKGIEFEKNLPKLIDLKADKNNFIVRQRMWKEDYVQYEKLVRTQAQRVQANKEAANKEAANKEAANKEAANQEEEKPAEINDESKLSALEKELGIVVDPYLAFENVQINRKKIETGDEKEFNTTGTIRLNQYYMTNLSNSKYDVTKVSRMNNIIAALIRKVDGEGVSTENFKKIQNLFTNYIKKMDLNEDAQDDYVTRTNNLWESVQNSIFYIIKYSNSYREKQYAALFSSKLVELGGGELNYHHDGDFVTKDEYFTDMVQNPKFINTKTGETYKRCFISVIDRPLFEHEPCLKDIKQGAVGDCYLMASLAAIISADPKKIKKMMKDNLDGTVTVRFFNTDEEKKPIYVKVSKTIPVDIYESGKVVDAFAKGPLWIKMIEKAYASVRLKNGRQQGRNYKYYVTNKLRTQANRFKFSYDNISGGNAYDTIKHITGEDTEIKQDGQVKLQFKTFESRMKKIDGNLTRPEVDALSFLLFKSKHDNDAAAMRYLANNRAKNKAYEKELKKYHHFRDLLEQTLIIIHGQDILNSMSSVAFIKALNEVLNSLSKFKDVTGSTPSDLALKEAGVPEEAIKYFKKCWKDYSKNGTDFFNDISAMVALFNADYQEEVANRGSEYTAEEEEIFNTIKDRLDAKKSVAFGIDELQSSNAKIKGIAGENINNGLVATHQYIIVGTEEIEYNGVKRKWLIVQNPHGHNIPVYKLNDDGSIKRIARKDSADYEYDIYDDQTSGLFLFELRDACSVINDLTFTK